VQKASNTRIGRKTTKRRQITLPASGYKSITINENAINNFMEIYESNKDNLKDKGIFSFTNFITHNIEKCLENIKIEEKHQLRFTKILIDEESIVFRDNWLKRIIDVLNEKGVLKCTLCNSEECLHIGYCYSMHELYGLIWK